MKVRKRISDKLLGHILLEKGVIQSCDLKKALSVQKRRKKPVFLGEILVELRMVAEEVILEAFLTQYRYAYIPVDQYTLDIRALASLPAVIAHKYFVLPIEKMFNTITVAMMNPLHQEALSAIAVHTKCSVVPCIAKPSAIRRLLQIHYTNTE